MKIVSTIFITQTLMVRTRRQKGKPENAKSSQVENVFTQQEFVGSMDFKIRSFLEQVAYRIFAFRMLLVSVNRVNA